MMKIQFSHIWFSNVTLNVLRVHYQLDEENSPIDICVMLTEEQLEEMHRLGITEGNIREIDPCEYEDIQYIKSQGIDPWKTKCYWLLFARLSKFRVLNSKYNSVNFF